jgi:hypothetical protein
MAGAKREAIGYGRINLAKKTGKPYFSLTMKDEFGNNVYHNGFIQNLIEVYIDPVTMAIVCYVEEIFRRGAFGSAGGRSVEVVEYIAGKSGKVERNIISLDDLPPGAIRSILIQLKTGEDAKYPHITFYKNDNDAPSAEGQDAGPSQDDSKPYKGKPITGSDPFAPAGDDEDPF